MAERDANQNPTPDHRMPTTIKTPDQRLRVFVSSTLGELAEERAAARRAIERLHLIPVMFELGARPHPPQELYRAYLDQSHVFIGIYWQSYGWVAPGASISGLEDEYLHAADQPKLIYVKQPAQRDERLDHLLALVAGNESYKKFTDTDELERLIAGDLALLLTERFAASTMPTATATATANVPLPVDAFVGRERELVMLQELLADRARLITLTGPGGVGKTRLALELASRVSHRFAEGSQLVALQSVRHPHLVASTIARTLKVTEPLSSPATAVLMHLREKQMLLVLDNFEQVLEASHIVTDILSACAGVSILVTSREVLNVRGEHQVPLNPLTPPPPDAAAETALSYAAVSLFADRAASIDPQFSLDPEKALAVAEITRRVDGLPLALELAAARTRVMTPQMILTRLEDRFTLLQRRGRDLPERHHALRTTIDWSFDLLTPAEQNLFLRLGVFVDGCTLEAIAATATTDEPHAVEMVTSLVEKSLLRRVDTEEGARYQMLETIREYALQRLEEAGILDEAADRHAAHYRTMAETAATALRGADQDRWVVRLALDVANIRAAFRRLIATKRWADCAAVVWGMWLYWWLREYVEDGPGWVTEIVDRDLAPVERARVQLAQAALALWQNDFETGVTAASEAVAVFEDIGDDASVALCELPLGFAEAMAGDAAAAVGHFSRSCDIFDRLGDAWGGAFARNALGWLWTGTMIDIPKDTFGNALARAKESRVDSELAVALANSAALHLRSGDLTTSREHISRSLELLLEAGVRNASSHSVDVAAELFLRQSQPATAARLFGMGDAIRDEIDWPLPRTHVESRRRLLEEVTTALGNDRFQREYAEGRALHYEQAMEAALAATAESNYMNAQPSE